MGHTREPEDACASASPTFGCRRRPVQATIPSHGRGTVQQTGRRVSEVDGGPSPGRPPGPATAEMPTRTPADPAAREIASGKPRHFPCFDGLRAISAMSILLCHTAWASGFTFAVLPRRLHEPARHERVGLFHDLGFPHVPAPSRSRTYRSESPNLRTYFQRRLLRIIPAYWLALTLLTYVLHLISLGPGWQGPAVHYLFLQIYFPTAVFYGITQAWTLCTEMAFYFFLPVFALLVASHPRSPRRQLLWGLGGIAVLYLVSIAFRTWAILIPVSRVVNGKVVAVCAPHCLTQPPYSTLLVNWLPPTSMCSGSACCWPC